MPDAHSVKSIRNELKHLPFSQACLSVIGSFDGWCSFFASAACISCVDTDLFSSDIN